MAAGVAMPNAHGQDMAKTATIVVNAKPWLPKMKNHTAKVKIDIATTTGTKTLTTLSANLWIGALLA
jgi:hypothetical protein